MENGKIVYKPRGGNPVLGNPEAEEIKGQINMLLINRDTKIGNCDMFVSDVNILPHKTSFFLGGVDKIEPEYYNEVKNYLGDQFNLIHETIASSLGKNSVGKAITTRIDYSEKDTKKWIDLYFLYAAFLYLLCVVCRILLENVGVDMTSLSNSAILYVFLYCVVYTIRLLCLKHPALRSFVEITIEFRSGLTHIIWSGFFMVLSMWLMLLHHVRNEMTTFGFLFRGLGY